VGLTPKQMKLLADRLDHFALGSGDIGKAADLIRQMAEQEPVAAVTGYFGGHCVIAPMNPAAVFSANMALYAAPPAPQPARVPMTLADVRQMIRDEFPDITTAEALIVRLVVSATERHHGIRSEE
jgi:hypothetical protein